VIPRCNWSPESAEVRPLFKCVSRGWFLVSRGTGLQLTHFNKSNLNFKNHKGQTNEKQINPSIKAQILRSAFILLALVAVSAIPFALAQSRSRGTAKRSVAASAVRVDRTLTFADRVAYQRAIEEVYWQHRIWPRNGGANASPKPPLGKVMSQAQIEEKVEDYLRNSQALEDYWQRPITPDQLQAEMERMASHTKQPECCANSSPCWATIPW